MLSTKIQEFSWMIHSRDSMNECPREASGIIRWALQGLDLLLVRDYVVSTPFKSISY